LASVLLAWTVPVQAQLLSFNYPNFSSTTGLTLVGTTQVTANQLELTTPANDQLGGVWYTAAKVDTRGGFNTTFQINIIPGGGDPADGMAFVMQNVANNALGGGGSSMGYAGLANSLAVEFDIFNLGVESNANHIAVQSNGAQPNMWEPEFTLPLGGGNSGQVNVTPPLIGAPRTVRVEYRPGSRFTVFYEGTQIINLANFNLAAVPTTRGPESILDANGALWFGFTGATGGLNASQRVVSWSLETLPIPEPSTLLLAAAGGLSLCGGWFAKRRRTTARC
jgi:hypothetical protein